MREWGRYVARWYLKKLEKAIVEEGDVMLHIQDRRAAAIQTDSLCPGDL